MKNLIFTSLIFFGFCSFTSFSQTQIGNAINGESLYDHLGCSVSLSSNGTMVAVRDHHNTNDTFDGRVRVYENLSGSWTQLGNEIVFDTVDASWFSQSINLSSDGTTLAIGSVLEASSTLVQVYKNIGGVWTQFGGDIESTPDDCFFGRSISLSADGNIVAIGIPSFPMCMPSSRVRIYQAVDSSWVQIGNDIGGNSNFGTGYSVCLSSDGSIVAVGDIGNPFSDILGSCSIYKNIDDSWVQIGQDIVGKTLWDGFGNSVALSADGTLVAIGARGNSNIDLGPVSTGYVSFYANVEGSWVQIGNDIEGEVIGDGFGQSIDLSWDGTIAAIGSTAPNSGKVSIYKTIAGEWTQIGNTIFGEANGDNFGASIGLSEDGSKLAVGAPLNDSNGDSAGQVKLFDLSALLSSDEFVKTSFSLYPNPASSHLTIHLSNGLILQHVYLYNSLGQLIKTSHKSILDVSNLSNGLYFIQVETSKGVATKEVIIN